MMSGRLLQAKNFIRSTIYMAQYRRFSEQVPVLSDTKASWEELLKFLLQNVINSSYDVGKKVFRLPFGPQVSCNGEESDALELTLRPFIGLGFLAKHSSSPEIEKIYCDVIRQGTDPSSEFFWGQLPTSQVLIENLSLLTGILLNPQKFWEPLTSAEQSNVLEYVASCSRREFVDNNWLWSKVFHLLFLQTFGEKKEGTQDIRNVLNRISEFYVGEGWYRDGLDEAEYRFDHYNSWAMHYYGLLFCTLAGPEFADIKKVLCARFVEFKKRYLLIFSEQHLPVAWGRSLIYRFGMLSCFGLASENNLIDAQETQEIKAIAVATINKFFREGILDQRGLLTMGFTGFNKSLLESYSGAGSPYWALKGFSFLILEASHDFWKAPSVGNRPKDVKMVHVSSGGFSVQQRANGHCLIVNGGSGSRIYSNKYNRFAFSNAFPLSFDKRCLDNCFSIFDGSEVRVFDTIVNSVNIQAGVVTTQWRLSSLPDIKAASTVVTVPDGYIVILHVETKNRYKFRFGGFCLPDSDPQEYKKIATVRIYQAREWQSPGFHRVLPQMNTLGKGGNINYLESYLEPGDNDLVFGAFASLSGAPEVPTYEEHEGRITVKATNFLKTFNKTL